MNGSSMYRRRSACLVLVASVLGLAGCVSSMPDAQQMAEFNRAGPPRPGAGTSQDGAGPSYSVYRLMSGDVLRLEMPSVVRMTTDSDRDRNVTTPYVCRVAKSGSIALPVVGHVKVAGKTLSEAESTIVAAYYPKYLVSVPAVVADVERSKPEAFMVTGLVNHAGAFPYPSDTRYTLLQAIAFAGGLNDIADPQYVKVYRQDAEGKMVAATFKVKGVGMMDAASVTIKPGDVVAVEHTAATRLNLFFAQTFRINAGINANVSYTAWNPYDENTTINKNGSWASFLGR